MLHLHHHNFPHFYYPCRWSEKEKEQILIQKKRCTNNFIDFFLLPMLRSVSLKEMEKEMSSYSGYSCSLPFRSFIFAATQ